MSADIAAKAPYIDLGAFAAAAGSSFGKDWRAASAVRAIVVGTAKPGPEGARLTRIDFGAAHAPSARPNPDLLVGDREPACAQHVDFRSADTLFYAGTWSSTPYHRQPMTYGHWEVMLLLEGEVAFGDAGGNEAMAGPGDLVVIPAGSAASWRAIGATRKLFVILRF